MLLKCYICSTIRDGVSSIFKTKQNKTNTHLYKSNAAQSSLLILCTCGGDRDCRAPPSAWVLMFQFSQNVSGWGVGVFPPANDSAQVRLRVDKTQRLDAIQTGENYECGRRGQGNITPVRWNIKRIKLSPEREWISVWLSAALSTEGEAGDEEQWGMSLF